MSRYKELLAQKQMLDKQIAEARRTEAVAALEDVRKTIADFGFTPEDIFGTRRKGSELAIAAKYRNPETGDAWSGRGRAPSWLKGKDFELFRVKE
jgi:DNA-binding protein H-NS